MTPLHFRKKEPHPNVFSSAKAGAHFLFVDNKVPSICEWFNGLCEAHGVEVVHEREGNEFMPSDEQKAAIQSYIDLFEHKPKLTAETAIRVARKN